MFFRCAMSKRAGERHEGCPHQLFLPASRKSRGCDSSFFDSRVQAAWDFNTFNLDRDMKIAGEKAGADLAAGDPDLKAIKARGGKLILYHGWSDAAIPAGHVISYYESVQKKMGQKETSEFVRLYMVPGMQHCAGGAGPNAFGPAEAARPGPQRLSPPRLGDLV